MGHSRTLRYAAAIAFAVGGPLHAQAPRQTVGPGELFISEISGGQLLDMCDGQGRVNQQFCDGYVVAASDILSQIHEVCRPIGVTTPQLVAVVVAYIRQRPADWHHQASFATREALKTAFPCRR